MKILVVAAAGESNAIDARLRAAGHVTFNGPASELRADVEFAIVVDAAQREETLEALRSLRAAVGPDLPLLAVTHAVEAERFRALLDAGASDYIVWPRDAGQLERRVALKTSPPPALRPSSAPPDALAFDVINAIPDAVYVKDADERLVFVNDAFCKLTGRTREELRGVAAGTMFGPYAYVSSSAVDKTDEEVLTTGAVRESEAKFTDREGRTHSLSTRKSLLRARGRNLIVGVIRDLTEKRRLETQLLLADRLSSVGTLAAGMAHEINNPLAYVLGNVGFVADSLPKLRAPNVDHDALIDEMAEALDDTLEGARRVRDIVRDLHAFSNSESSPNGQSDVRRAIEASLRMVWGEVKHRARLVVDVGRLPVVTAAEPRLGHVFVNLLVNAAQSFKEPGAVENEVAIRAWSDETHVLIEIADNGRGMEEDVARRVFDPFFTTKAVGEGAGLGLFVSHSIVRSFGGTIEVETKAGYGSKFRVSLPIAKGEEVKAEESVVPSTTLGPIRVLVIDDEPRIGAVVRRMLARGFDVDVVEDAPIGLEKIHAGELYDVILCDLMLPTMSGMAFYEALSPEMQKRVIFATAGAFTEQAQTFLEGFSGRRLDKPFEREALRTALRDMAAKNRKILHAKNM